MKTLEQLRYQLDRSLSTPEHLVYVRGDENDDRFIISVDFEFGRILKTYRHFCPSPLTREEFEAISALLEERK